VHAWDHVIVTRVASMKDVVCMCCIIIGAPVTDLRAEQTGLTTVLVTWTAPSPAPSRPGYRVTVTTASISETTTGTSSTVTIPHPGNYTIQVQHLSLHYPSEAVSVEVTVRGEG
jgi:hypothetical protein